jgi:thiamine biosynthesis lipoprotein
MQQTRTIMGMPVRLEIVDPHATQTAYDEVFAYLTSVDERFSTYMENSEISRINRGEILPAAYSDEMKKVFALAHDTEKVTEGYFSIHSPDGSIDPSGLVKGWAINNASSLLRDHGFQNFYIEIAGDIQTSGKDSRGEEWSIGIRNPFVREEIVKVFYPHGNGIATSGTYERGAHIYNPLNPDATAYDFVSFTVIGPDIYEADRFATAAFVMGVPGMHFIERLDGFEAYAIDAQGRALMTSGIDAYTTI